VKLATLGTSGKSKLRYYGGQGGSQVPKHEPKKLDQENDVTGGGSLKQEAQRWNRGGQLSEMSTPRGQKV